MEIVVRQTSGLGNQLFQYAAGQNLAKKHGASLRIAHELDKNIHLHGSPRPVMLQKFSITAPIGEADGFDRFILSVRPRLRMITDVVCGLRRIQIFREPANASATAVRPSFPVSSSTRRVYLQGYWQDSTLVSEVEPELRKQFSLVSPLSRRSSEVQQQIQASQHPVSLHLRRGDYLTVFGTSAVLPPDYYRTAVDSMHRRFADSSFFVFSDDARYAKELFGHDPRFRIVDHNDALSAHEDLMLMASCHHHIIANSTFSWWGAWLNPRPDKVVIAPSKWLGFNTVNSTIALPSWHLIEI